MHATNMGQTPLHLIGYKPSRVSHDEEESVLVLGLSGSAGRGLTALSGGNDDDGADQWTAPDDFVFRELMDNGADVIAVDANGTFPFFVSAATGWFDASFEILRLGARSL